MQKFVIQLIKKSKGKKNVAFTRFYLNLTSVYCAFIGNCMVYYIIYVIRHKFIYFMIYSFITLNLIQIRIINVP